MITEVNKKKQKIEQKRGTNTKPEFTGFILRFVVKILNKQNTLDMISFLQHFLIVVSKIYFVFSVKFLNFDFFYMALA